MKRPRITVITCHMTERIDFLLEAYQSLRNQTETNWQWLIEAEYDSKTDRLPDDDRVSVRLNPDKFDIATKRNQALFDAKGEYIAVLDDDDMLPEKSLEIRADALDKNPHVGFSFGYSENIETGNSRPFSFSPGEVPLKEIYLNWLRRRKEGLPGVSPPTTTALWRAEPIWRVGGWSALSRGEDTAMMMRISVLYPAFFIPEVVYRHRRHQSNTTSTKWRSKENWDWIEKSVETFLKESNL